MGEIDDTAERENQREAEREQKVINPVQKSVHRLLKKECGHHERFKTPSPQPFPQGEKESRCGALQVLFLELYGAAAYLLPAISAYGYGHFVWQARQGELAGRRTG
jgi:hypothetical protein